ncbi:MAG: mannitol dehydrogenase family protein [Bacillota bacterium]
MKLSKKAIEESHIWSRSGIELPRFDLEEVIKATRERPAWVHFGAGNILRGFLAVLQQTLLNLGKAETGIVAVETYDLEIIDRVYTPYDNLSLLVLMKPDGSLDKKVVGSILESLAGDISRARDWERLKSIFCEPSLQMVSFTITEKGYCLTGISGDYLPDVKHDIEYGPEQPVHVIGKIASLAYTRYLNGELPIAFVSMDNCSHNGEILKSAVQFMADKWTHKGYVDSNFSQYLNNPSRVSFPWTMIDKITPRPSEKVRDALSQIGFESTQIVCTDKKTFIAPFVNAESSEYLVIEDHFPNGRMPLELAGVIFADRKTVELAEKMKVSTCLNPLHTSLAVFGCLLGYQLIADEMRNKHLKMLVEKIGYDEGMPIAAHPGIIDPQAFIKEVIEVRLPNPYIPDSPQRIAADTSQKMPIRFGETIKAYCADPQLDVKDLKAIPLVIAGWCRYLLSIDDYGENMDLSPDPMMDELKAYLREIEFGNVDSAGDSLKPILSNRKLFGSNLYDIGLGQRIEDYFKEMISGKHAVRNVLQKYIEDSKFI